MTIQNLSPLRLRLPPLITTHPISHSIIYFPQNLPSSQIFQSSPLFTHLRLLAATEIQHLFISTRKSSRRRSRKPNVERETFPFYHFCRISYSKEKTSAPPTLSTCLLAAVISGNTRIVQQLLVFGVSVNIPSVRIAITDKALDILSLFVRYGGWDVNQEVEWCYSAPLS